MGQVFYRSWSPGSFQDPTYNPNNAQPTLESWQSYTPKSLPFQPMEYWDNRLSPASYALANEQRGAYTSADEIFYPVADEHYRVSPPQPVRYDTFNQLKQIAQNQAVSGQAPTKGIYTGTIDLAE